MSLRKQAVSGMVWTFSQQFGTQIISFIVGIILARLLMPSDFGAVAMFSVIIAIASSLMNGGMSSSLIRTKEIDNRDLSTVFWFNLVTAISLYIGIYLTAPLVAKFYRLDILTTVIRIYAISILIQSLVAVQSTLFVKNLDFKTSFLIQLPSILIGAITGIVLALKGYGIWALVIYPLVQTTIVTIQYWFYSKWRPDLVFDRTKFLYHFQFGYKMTLSDVLNTIFKNIYTILIGKLFSPTQLGYYNRADSLKQMPVSNLSAALNKVTFPLFAKISHDNIKLKATYQKLLKLVIFIIAPILGLMIVTAEPLIRVLLTEKWLPAVPYFQVLAIAGVLYPIHAYNLNILMVKGRSDLFLKLEIWKKVLIVVTLVFSIPYGVIGIAWGQVICSIAAFFINTHYTGKFLNYGSLQQFRDLVPVLLLTSIVTGVIYLLDINYFFKIHDYLRLSVLSLIFALIYGFSVWSCRFKELEYIKELLKK